MENNVLYTKKNLVSNVKLIIDETAPLVSNLSNISRVIYESMTDTSWCGFYLADEVNRILYLAPFQGPVACTKIAIGKGVCGNSYQKMETEIVPNVHEYPGHIACSNLTNSEIVVPLIRNNQCLGVLDLDSEKFDNYDVEDAKLLEAVVKEIVHLIK